jgi:N-acetyl-1-D-myo-inositol-2-amino-2-deoxy-alpha-D-glucopyranoside deacetylase
MSNGIVQPLLGVEEYVLAGAPPGTTETDLFEGVDG